MASFRIDGRRAVGGFVAGGDGEDGAIGEAFSVSGQRGASDSGVFCMEPELLEETTAESSTALMVRLMSCVVVPPKSSVMVTVKESGR